MDIDQVSDRWNVAVNWAANTKKDIKEGKIGMNVTLLYIAALCILITLIVFISLLIYRRVSSTKTVKDVRQEIITVPPSMPIQTTIPSKTNPNLQQKLAEVDFIIPPHHRSGN